MIAVNFTQLIVVLCAFVVSVKLRDSSYDSYYDIIPKLLDRMEKMETKMKEMENRELSMQAEIRILNNELSKQKEETKRLKVLLTLDRAEKYNSDDFRIPRQSNDVEYDSKAVNNIKKTTKDEFHIRHATNQPVAFSTYLSQYANHFGIDRVIKYDGILTNEGNAYNPQTGMFVCPQDGLYLISFFITTIFNNVGLWVQLMVDNINVSDAVAYAVGGGLDDQGGNVAILRLRMGQAVWTQTHFNGDVTLAGTTEFRHVTFSGVRLSD